MPAKLIPLLLAATGLTACASVATDPAPVAVRIVAINDFHGNLEMPSGEYRFTENGQERSARLGGAAQLAATLQRLDTPDTLIVAAGDLIGASPLSSSLFLDEPSIRALSAMGLDIAAVGNHEFDRGIAELRRMQDGGCEANTRRQPCALEPFAGADFRYLAANVVDDAGATLFPATAMREVAGAKIGFIGMTLEGTPNYVAAQATAGYTFLDEADTANRLAGELRGQGADALVVLLHEGASVDPSYNLDGCPNIGGAVVPIIERLDPSIALVVSGHTHQAYVCTYTRADGSSVLLTSAGRYGTFVTEIAMNVDPASDRVTFASATNVPVDGRDGSHPAAEAIVRRYVEAAGPVANRQVGTITDTGERGEDCGDRPAQDFVADAYLMQGRAALAATGQGTVDMAFVNSGGVRTGFDGAADGVLTFGELAAMAPFGNGVIVLDMTGAQIRAVLEQQFCEEGGTVEVCDSVLIPSAGVAYTADTSREAGQRITALTLDGEPLDPDRRYRVATNSFLVGGGDGFALFAQVPVVANAGFDIDGLEAYVAQGNLMVPVCGRVRNVAAAD
ncbi:bifunctional metallophosphatase/5'-nucleotidase [Aurantiacibacter arachoides]|nr:bifunctional metallophosphatase/5'-nucleotidase [Aurantiacibacter arachoides]GGD53888.1 multifunctional 2',3'-cyclic-nucleotide 2'-phosphodiesterase/5'-nucleotidase/3'-nucleotidase [Aurantiacibacter arachoides]